LTARVLIAATATLLVAATTATLPLKALRWTAPGQALASLTTQPPECLHVPADPDERASLELGRAAFRTPMLLGGQAARLGLSCDSCHSNGRRNPAFLFPGLSGDPGTADVTNALMSTHRDNGTFDPRPIPDLAAPGKVDRRADRPDLRRFIHGLIVDEFDGNEPPPAVLGGLAAYVRHIGAAGCAPAVSVVAGWSDTARRAVTAARERADVGDVASSRLMLAAARSALGRLDEGYADIAADHALLVKQDARLAALQTSIDDALLAHWLGDSPRWTAALLRDEPQSLFNPARLAARIDRAAQ
jgi:hypothetical protein